MTSKRIKACWACRSSKVRCDLNLPACKTCARTGKDCQYGLLLSWPREDDPRRSMVARKKSRKNRASSAATGIYPRFLNVGCSDVALYLFLSSGASNRSPEYLKGLQLLLHTSISRDVPKPLSWKPSESSEFENHLMTLYEHVLCTMLTSAEDERFRGLLIGMSFIDSTPSTLAVQQAIYAVIAVYTYGPELAMPFKFKAINALRRSIPSSLNAKDGLQHIAAALLLCLYEMLHSSEYSYQWEIYAGGAKQIAKKIYRTEEIYEGDALAMLNWIFYHDALFRFSVRHWRHSDVRSRPARSCARDDQIMKMALLSCNPPKIISTIGCSAEVLEAIANTFRLILDLDDPVLDSPSHIEALDRLERRLTFAKQHTEQIDETKHCARDERNTVAELYRLAGLLYLYRAGKRLPQTHPKVRKAFASALSLIPDLQTCTRSFPIVIIGCEARSDTDRLVILSLLERTAPAQCRATGNIVGAQRFIEASWAQDDLCVGDELDYVTKLDAIMSLSRCRPSFAVSLMGSWEVGGKDAEWKGHGIWPSNCYEAENRSQNEALQGRKSLD